MSQEEFIEAVFNYIIEVEGVKYTNHPNDSGGSTKYGVTQKLYDHYKKNFPNKFKNTPENVKDFTQDDAKLVYSQIYLDSKAEKIKDERLRLLYFDHCINSGISGANNKLNQMVGVQSKRILSSDTLKKIEEHKGDMTQNYYEMRKQHYQEIIKKNSKNKIFEKGWNNRLDKCIKFANDNFSKQENKSNQQVGGIDLDTKLKLMKNIRGLKVSANYRAKFILDTKLEQNGVDIEDLAICLQVYYDNSIKSKAICFSLDPWEENNPSGQFQKKILYPDFIEKKKILEGSRFGELLFECDYLMKLMALGFNSDCISPFRYPQELLDKGLLPIYQIKQFQQNNNQQYGQNNYSRLWIVCKEVKGRVDDCTQELLLFDDVKVGVEARQMVQDFQGKLKDRTIQDESDPCYIFARKFTQLYPIICKYYKCFEKIKKLYKAVALARWIQNKKISVDLDLIQKVTRKQFINISSYTNKINTVKKELRFKVGQTQTQKGNQIVIQEQYKTIHILGGVDMNCQIKEVSNQDLQEIQSSMKQNSVYNLSHLNFNALSKTIENQDSFSQASTSSNVSLENFDSSNFSECEFFFQSKKNCQTCKYQLTYLEMNYPYDNKYYCNEHHPLECKQCYQIISDTSYFKFQFGEDNQNVVLHEKCKEQYQILRQNDHILQQVQIQFPQIDNLEEITLLSSKDFSCDNCLASNLNTYSVLCKECGQVNIHKLNLHLKEFQQKRN